MSPRSALWAWCPYTVYNGSMNYLIQYNGVDIQLLRVDYMSQETVGVNVERRIVAQGMIQSPDGADLDLDVLRRKLIAPRRRLVFDFGERKVISPPPGHDTDAANGPFCNCNSLAFIPDSPPDPKGVTLWTGSRKVAFAHLTISTVMKLEW